jgi:dimethylamine/trimethylamine dehydrogenase
MPRDPRFDPLFQPLKIGPVTAPNRFWQVPHCTGMGNRHPQTLAQMRKVKAEGGWGVVNTEYCSIHESSDDTPAIHASLWDDHDIRAHALMTAAVHDHGSLAGVELWHGGARASNAWSRAPGIAPQSVMAQNVPWQTQKMDRQDVAEFRAIHKAAALRAIAADFDVVYVYAAHTYLLAQFLDPVQNPGKTFDERANFVLALAEDTRNAVGHRAAVATRIEVLNEDNTGLEERSRLLERLAPFIDVFDVTIPDYGTEMGPSRFVKEAPLETHIAHVRGVTGKPVVSVGRFTSPETMLSQIRRGVLDFIGAARPSIADPFLPAKIRDGRMEEIRECIGCNICYAHDGLGAPIRCTQNPTMGEEFRQGWHPENVPAIIGQADPVLIVGAGPAGLEAAITLGKRGVPVMLAEAQEPGGRVLREARLPGLSEWGRVVDWRLSQIARLPQVTLYPGSAMTADDVRETGVSHVMVATGSLWRATGLGRSLPGGEASFADPRTLTPDAILTGQRPAQGPVVVWDDEGYHIAAGLADLLASEGFPVTYVTPNGTVAEWSGQTVEQDRLQSRLIDRGVTIHTSRIVTRLTQGHAVLTCAFTGAETTIPCTGFVPVTSREPQDGLWRDLQGLPLQSLTRIGDARAPGLIAHAVHDGHRAARAHLTPLPKPRREVILLG